MAVSREDYEDVKRTMGAKSAKAFVNAADDSKNKALSKKLFNRPRGGYAKHAIKDPKTGKYPSPNGRGM